MDYSSMGGKPVQRGGNGTGGDHAPLPFIANPAAQPPTVDEIIVGRMALALTNVDVAIFGAVSLWPLAACRLAQLTHAPDLTVIAGPSGGINPAADPLVPSVGDFANLAGEALLDFPEALGIWAGGRANVFFAGGLEIDQWGNANLVGSAQVRGPGAAGLPLAAAQSRTILYTATHTPRLFVPRVAHVTARGWADSPTAGDTGPGRAQGGPVLLLTPLAVCDFAPSGRMRLVSVHPGVSVAQVQAATGFPLLMPGEVPTTPVLPPDRLRLLRQLDSGGLLRPTPR